MYRDLDAAELAARLGTDQAPFVLDVREPAEFAQWAIPSAVNIPLGALAARLEEIPRDREIVSVCASGNRSTTAAEFLTGTGRHVANLAGGMVAWGSVYDAVTLELDTVRVVQVRRRGKGCLSYLVGSVDQAFVIDPSTDTAVYQRLADEHGWRITDVFDTHLHADHVSGARVLSEVTGSTLHLNPLDAFGFPYDALHDGERFELPGGGELSVAVMGTPGHTRGSTVFVVAGQAILSGDVLFIESVGRPDLADQAEAFARQLFHSLHDKVLALPDHVTVLPAHYGDQVVVLPDTPVSARLGDLRASLPPLSYDEDGFVAWAQGHVTARPPNYARIVELNQGRPMPSIEELRALEMGPNRCAVSG